MSIVTTLLLATGTLATASVATPVSWPDFAPPQECSSQYAEALTRASHAAANGEYEVAAQAFVAALEAPCHEIPNYELYGPLAEMHCRSGDVAVGRSLVADYECMLAVDAGELKCYVNASRSAASPERAPGLTDRCFEVMCGEIFLPYYDKPAASTRARIAQLRGAAQQLRVACGDRK